MTLLGFTTPSRRQSVVVFSFVVHENVLTVLVPLFPLTTPLCVFFSALLISHVSDVTLPLTFYYSLLSHLHTRHLSHLPRHLQPLSLPRNGSHPIYTPFSLLISFSASLSSPPPSCLLGSSPVFSYRRKCERTKTRKCRPLTPK